MHNSEAQPDRPLALSIPELVAMVAALSALNALSIDIMLPALPDIGRTFQLTNDNDRQLVVVAYVTLFGIAQLVYGPLADAFGRRSVLVWSLGIFIIGSVLCVFAPSFELLLAARALQGVGAAATRVISTAVVRDLMSGRRMAQVMSMAMTVFMIVPIIGPSIGQLILFAAPWQWIFGALLIYALVILVWTLLRLPETLAPENRTRFSPGAAAAAYLSVLRDRQMVGYMIATTFIIGALFGYITSAEQIYVDVFGLGAKFPLAFGAIAIAISIGTFANSRLVIRFGMRRLSHGAVIVFTLISALHAALWASDLMSFWLFMVLLAPTLGAFGMIAGNFSALAMERLGNVAGSAAALYGAVTSFAGAFCGALIARGFDGTPLPFVIGLVVMGVLAFASIYWTERGRLFTVGGS